MFKKMFSFIICSLFLACSLSGCSQNTASSEKNTAVSLTVWGAEGDTEHLEELVAKFKEQNKNEAPQIDIKVVPKSAGTCKEELFKNIENGPDLFTFPDDQIRAMVAAGVLAPAEDAANVAAASLPDAAEIATINGKLYAYPLTADNGYFLYYNKEYVTDGDVQTLDSLMAKASSLGKKFTMDWSSGWYLFSFFGNTGMELGLNADGISNHCNYNATDTKIKGVDVAAGMMSIASNAGFLNCGDSDFIAGMKDGSVVAGVSGIWDAKELEGALGANYGAAKLPTYTAGNGEQVQMASFHGYKLIGVNSYSNNIKWAHKLAAFITSEEAQIMRFKSCGQGPANKNAAANPEIANSLAVKALAAQLPYASLQQVGGKYWGPMEDFGKKMLGNDAEPLQTIVNQLNKGITAQYE